MRFISLQKPLGFLIFEALISVLILSLVFIAAFRSFHNVLVLYERTAQSFFAVLAAEEAKLYISLNNEKGKEAPLPEHAEDRFEIVSEHEEIPFEDEEAPAPNPEAGAIVEEGRQKEFRFFEESLAVNQQGTPVLQFSFLSKQKS